MISYISDDFDCSKMIYLLNFEENLKKLIFIRPVQKKGKISEYYTTRNETDTKDFLVGLKILRFFIL